LLANKREKQKDGLTSSFHTRQVQLLVGQDSGQVNHAMYTVWAAETKKKNGALTVMESTKEQKGRDSEMGELMQQSTGNRI